MTLSSFTWRSFAAIGLAVSAFAPAAQADAPADLDTFLREFRANPAQTMNEQPTHLGAPSPVRVSGASIRSREFVTDKDRARQQFCTLADGARVCLSDVLPGRSAYQNNDLAQNLVDNASSMVRSVDEMDSRGLRAARLPESPWSDTYWPIYEGLLGARYADSNFPDSQDWKDNFDYTQQADHLVSAILAGRDSSSIDDLSPSEKYDLLVGDAGGRLTAAMWNEGRGYYQANGSVETWMGICHGWSPAAYMVGRPLHAVALTAADGRTRLNFYPSDVKGLASLLWAKTRPNTRFIGGRCDVRNPATDSNGRIIDQNCFDTNPGTWHLAVVNQIGISRRGMVIDATYDYEVWNQPVYSYQYSYFNPQSGSSVATLAAAKVAMSDFSEDRFKSYRSPNARSVVGIQMALTYVQETVPTHAANDSPSRDSLHTVIYRYDLELDGNDNILGGEWYQNAHPDFIWTPPPGGRALSAGDAYATEGWSGEGAVPTTWQRAAQSASPYGQPLSKVVDVLDSLSRL